MRSGLEVEETGSGGDWRRTGGGLHEDPWGSVRYSSLLPSGEQTTECTPELWPSNVLKEFVYNPWLGVVIGRLAIVAI